MIRVRQDAKHLDDWVVVEEPLEIRVNGESLAVVMRTPGNEEDLALGFAITEGIVSRPSDIVAIDSLGEGRWELRLAKGVTVEAKQFQRNFYSTSSCGVCGKASIDAIRVTGGTPPPGPVFDQDTLLALPEKLIAEQHAFHSTGGIHAAAAFESDGRLVAVREDVGRHNAVDKLVGHLARQGWPLAPMAFMVSGRISFEITQKAAVAGVGIVAGVSAASTLAIDLAEEMGMTVVGFVRQGGFTVYCGEQRIRGLS